MHIEVILTILQGIIHRDCDIAVNNSFMFIKPVPTVPCILSTLYSKHLSTWNLMIKLQTDIPS